MKEKKPWKTRDVSKIPARCLGIKPSQLNEIPSQALAEAVCINVCETTSIPPV